MGKIFNALERYQNERNDSRQNKMKLTNSDWIVLLNYDRESGHLLQYDSGTGRLDGNSIEVLKNNGTIHRLLEHKLIFPGGKLTPLAKKVVEKRKHEPKKSLKILDQDPSLKEKKIETSDNNVGQRDVQTSDQETELKDSDNAKSTPPLKEKAEEAPQNLKPELVSDFSDLKSCSQLLSSEAQQQCGSRIHELKQPQLDTSPPETLVDSEVDEQADSQLANKLNRPETSFRDKKLHESLVCLNKPDSFEAEQFKILRTNLLYPVVGNPPRSILITGANPGEGKSFVASNLAITVALNIDKFVLLVDCDLRRPVIHRRFGFKNVPGLSEYLTNGSALPSLLLQTPFEKLTILPGGNPPPNPSELLSSDRMSDLLKEITERYSDRLIIIDSPPPSLTAETGVLARQVEGILLVVKAYKTGREDVANLIEKLGKDKIIGSVFNYFDYRTMGYSGYKKYSNYGRYYKNII